MADLESEAQDLLDEANEQLGMACDDLEACRRQAAELADLGRQMAARLKSLHREATPWLQWDKAADRCHSCSCCEAVCTTCDLLALWGEKAAGEEKVKDEPADGR